MPPGGTLGLSFQSAVLFRQIVCLYIIGAIILWHSEASMLLGNKLPVFLMRLPRELNVSGYSYLGQLAIFRDKVAAIAGALALVSFRKRKLALATTSLGSILALGSLGFQFHPSLAGLLLLLGCAAALYFHSALVL